MRWVASLGAAALLLVTGCGTPPDAPARTGTTATASASSVAWMAEFCTVVGDLRTALWGSAADPGPGDPATLRQSFSVQLSTAADALQTAADRVDGLPESPPPGASEAAAEWVDQITALRDTVRTGQRTLAALPSNAAESELGEVMGTVWPSVAARAGKPLDGVTVTADMKAAATDPACRLLRALR